MVPLHDLYNADVAPAVDWLKAQPYVDKSRIIMSGVSYGGIQTLVSAQKIPGVRGYIPKGAPNQAKLYPAFGADDDHRKGHGAFACWNIGTEIWGMDVMSFIDAVLKR